MLALPPLQGLWKGVLPSLVMVSNPTVNYMLYEYLRARLEEWRALLAGESAILRATSPVSLHLSLALFMHPCGTRCIHGTAQCLHMWLLSTSYALSCLLSTCMLLLMLTLNNHNFWLCLAGRAPCRPCFGVGGQSSLEM